MNSPVPAIALSNGVEIPQLGFGAWQVEDESAFHTALEIGYRAIDTAAAYGNEAAVGRAIAASGLPREEMFVTTKVWNDSQGREATLASFEQSRERLGLDIVDLLLIHWPAPGRDLYVETWHALEELYGGGSVRAIGVSNFEREHLERLFAESDVVPMVNQVELHPYLQQRELRIFHAEHGIVTEDWSPLGQGGRLLADPVVEGLASKHGNTPAQVVLRWHLQIGSVVFPKSVTPARIRENFDVFDFELTSEDMAQLGALDAGERIGPNPRTFG